MTRYEYVVRCRDCGHQQDGNPDRCAECGSVNLVRFRQYSG